MLSITGQEAINLVMAAVGVTVLLAGVVAVMFSQLRKNTTQIVRDENTDLRQRLATVEDLEERCKERLTDLEITTRHLADMLTGASAVAELATLVAFHHDENTAALRRVLDKLDEMAPR